MRRRTVAELDAPLTDRERELAGDPGLVGSLRRIADGFARARGADPDSALSEALLAVARAARLHSGSGGASFRTYAIRRARGAMLDALRADGRRGFTDVPQGIGRGRGVALASLDADPDGVDPPAPEPRPDDAPSRPRAHDLLGCLDGPLRAVVEMQLAGESAVSTGLALGLHRRAVEKMRADALRRLREHANPSPLSA